MKNSAGRLHMQTQPIPPIAVCTNTLDTVDIDVLLLACRMHYKGKIVLIYHLQAAHVRSALVCFPRCMTACDFR